MRGWIASLFVFAAPAVAAEHWAYRAPQEPRVPENAAGRMHPVDALLEQARAKAGVKAVGLAAPGKWVERAAFTLTGLPPSLEQLARIQAKPDEATWLGIIDEMLASPAYGERWARHWMDVARYADTQGYNFDQDNRYPFAYTYRDWLIRAFREDLPYGDFIKLQLAADQLVARPDHPDLAALGFLTVGPRAGNLEIVDDRVDVVTRGFLGSTVACARCHDHKTDPITARDYYSLFSIFENTREPDERPRIGTSDEGGAYQDYVVKMEELERQDEAVRQAMVDQVRTPESCGVYLELAWQAHRDGWDQGKAAAGAFKRGRYRPDAVIRWRDFLIDKAWGKQAVPRLERWAREMDAATEDERRALSRVLAEEWNAASGEDPLAVIAKEPGCPLSYDVHRISEFMDQEDRNQERQRKGARSRLQAEHPGSPPRAMVVADRGDSRMARVFARGNPAQPGEAFEREWLGFLGGGTFREGISPRLALAERIADPGNPLTARVMVNRVWAWHFGTPLADPGDFGPQQPEPVLLPLLDWLALRFQEQGGSLKQLHRLLLSSRAFRLASDGPVENETRDEANTFFWKWNLRRVDFESMRDRLLATSGALDLTTTGGRSVNLEDPAADTRRTVYGFVDRYALPSTFVSFDFPHPDHHSPKRTETSVPQQALYFLNHPLVIRQAARLAGQSAAESADAAARVAWIYRRIYQREPSAGECQRAVAWVRSARPGDFEPRLGGGWEVRYATDLAGKLGEVRAFPLFADQTWKTGADLATAPVRWLHARAEGGHAAAGHAMILRWRATGSGMVRMVGTLRRTQKGGVPLEWEVVCGKGSSGVSVLKPEGKAIVGGPWFSVAAGDPVDFLLRAPHGDTCGSVAWDLRILGKDSDADKETEISKLAREFPKTASAQSLPAAGDPWADFIQMLWAANEFHFID